MFLFSSAAHMESLYVVRSFGTAVLPNQILFSFSQSQNKRETSDVNTHLRNCHPSEFRYICKNSADRVIVGVKAAGGFSVTTWVSFFRERGADQFKIISKCLESGEPFKSRASVIT